MKHNKKIIIIVSVLIFLLLSLIVFLLIVKNNASSNNNKTLKTTTKEVEELTVDPEIYSSILEPYFIHIITATLVILLILLQQIKLNINI